MRVACKVTAGAAGSTRPSYIVAPARDAPTAFHYPYYSVRLTSTQTDLPADKYQLQVPSSLGTSRHTVSLTEMLGWSCPFHPCCSKTRTLHSLWPLIVQVGLIAVLHGHYRGNNGHSQVYNGLT